jgi:hypothetical protein
MAAMKQSEPKAIDVPVASSSALVAAVPTAQIVQVDISALLRKGVGVMLVPEGAFGPAAWQRFADNTDLARRQILPRVGLRPPAS